MPMANYWDLWASFRKRNTQTDLSIDRPQTYVFVRYKSWHGVCIREPRHQGNLVVTEEARLLDVFFDVRKIALCGSARR